MPINKKILVTGGAGFVGTNLIKFFNFLAFKDFYLQFCKKNFIEKSLVVEMSCWLENMASSHIFA